MYVRTGGDENRLSDSFLSWNIGVVRIIWEIDATDITYVHRHMIFILNGLDGETIFQCLMYMLIVNDKFVGIVLGDVGLRRRWMIFGAMDYFFWVQLEIDFIAEMLLFLISKSSLKTFLTLVLWTSIPLSLQKSPWHPSKPPTIPTHHPK